MTNRTKEICEKIGQFYLQKHKNNYESAEEEILRVGFTKVIILSQKDIAIYVKRVGIFIGMRGENIENLENFLGVHIFIMEETDNVENWIIPYNDSYERLENSLSAQDRIEKEMDFWDR